MEVLLGGGGELDREWEWERVRMREETFFISFPQKVFMSVEEG